MPPSLPVSSPSSRHRRGLLWGLALLVCGCLPALPHIDSGEAPAFDAIAFFEGSTEGLGTLTIRTRSPQTVQVQSVGTRTPGGGLTLVQSVRLGDAPPSERTWVLRPAGSARWTGTLTDADGPVEAWAEGDRLWIRYSMPRGLSMHQELTLQPDGGLALNLATVRFWGLPIARLTEQIWRMESKSGDSLPDPAPEDPANRDPR